MIIKKVSCLILLTFIFVFSCKKTNTKSASVYEFTNINENVAKGWLHHVLQTELNGVSGHLDEFAPQIKRNPFVNQITKADSGKVGGMIGELAGNWIDGFVNLAYVSKDPEAIKKAEKWVADVIQVYKNDTEPYLGVYKEGRWLHPDLDLWGQSRVMLALLAYYDATKNKEVLDMLVKSADLMVQKYVKDNNPLFTKEKAGKYNTHALMIVEPFSILYKLTGKTEYIEFCELVFDRLRYYNDKLLAGKLYLHGVHVVENVRIPALLYNLNNKSEYLKMGKDGVDLVLNNYINSAGAIRSDELVSYQEPNRASEYCTMTEWMMTCSEMVKTTGDMKYADAAERCFYNAAQGARLSNGKGIQYLSYPNQLHTEDQVGYGPCHNPLCCNPNAARLYPYFIKYMWMKNNNGINAIYYGPCELNTEINKVKVSIQQKTNYPFNEKIEFDVNPVKQVAFAFSFRIPSWCIKPEVKINGKVEDLIINNAMLSINREWNKNDKIELYLPMSVKPEYGKNDLVAITRGPLVYSLELKSVEKDSLKITSDLKFVNYELPKNTTWNYCLYFNYLPKKDIETTSEFAYDMVNIDSTFRIENKMLSDTIDPWSEPHMKIFLKARPLYIWKLNESKDVNCYLQNHYHKQPGIPFSPIYRYSPIAQWNKEKEDLTEIKLVPYGTTRLRITNFPFFLWWL